MRTKLVGLGLCATLGLSGCSLGIQNVTLPGGADTGDNPYRVTVDFADVLDLVPQASVKVNDVSVGNVERIELNGFTARVTLKVRLASPFSRPGPRLEASLRIAAAALDPVACGDLAPASGWRRLPAMTHLRGA